MSAEFNLDTLQLGAKIPMGKCTGTVKLEQNIDIHYSGYNDNGVMRLLMYDVQPDASECEIIETGVYVKGNVLVQAFGVNVCDEDNNELWNAAECLPYETVIKCDDFLSLNNPMCKAMARVTSADIRVNDRQILNVTVTLAITVKVYETGEHELVVGASEDDDLRIKLKSMPFHVFEGAFNETSRVEDKLVLPQAKPAIDRIVLSKYSLSGYNVKQNNEMFDVTGEVNVCVVYLADETSEVDELIQCCEFTVPFAFSVATDSVSAGAECVPTISVSGFGVKEAEDEDGEYREIDVQMDINACLECFNNIETEVVEDVFCIGKRVKLAEETLTLDSVAGEHSGSIPCIKGIEMGEEASSQPQDVLMSSGRIRDCALMLKDEKPLLTGTAEARVVFTVQNEEGENEYKSLVVELPFQQEIDGCSVEAETDYSHMVNVENCRSIMTMGNVLETKLDVVYGVTETRGREVKIPVGVEEDNTNTGTAVATWMNADDEIIMYVVKDNEDVWDIAKHFLVAPENILNIEGEQVDDSVIAGSRVFIV